MSDTADNRSEKLRTAEALLGQALSLLEDCGEHLLAARLDHVSAGIRDKLDAEISLQPPTDVVGLK